jgi:hypothetical protein
MQTWRRQTLIVGICFAVVVFARLYFKHHFGAVDDDASGGLTPNQGSTSMDEPRDTVVTLDTNP